MSIVLIKAIGFGHFRSLKVRLREKRFQLEELLGRTQGSKGCEMSMAAAEMSAAAQVEARLPLTQIPKARNRLSQLI